MYIGSCTVPAGSENGSAEVRIIAAYESDLTSVGRLLEEMRCCLRKAARINPVRRSLQRPILIVRTQKQRRPATAHQLRVLVFRPFYRVLPQSKAAPEERIAIEQDVDAPA